MGLAIIILIVSSSSGQIPAAFVVAININGETVVSFGCIVYDAIAWSPFINEPRPLFIDHSIVEDRLDVAIKST